MNHPTIKGVPVIPGCYIDGHTGQYGLAAVVTLADRMLGLKLSQDFPKANDGSLAGSIGPGGVWDIGNPHTEACVEVADKAEAALNEATEGGTWGWEDGEFFLRADGEDEDG